MALLLLLEPNNLSVYTCGHTHKHLEEVNRGQFGFCNSLHKVCILHWYTEHSVTQQENVVVH